MIAWPRPSHQTFILSYILNHANEMWLVLQLGFLRQMDMLHRVDGCLALLFALAQGWTVSPVGPRQHSVCQNIVIQYI